MNYMCSVLWNGDANDSCAMSLFEGYYMQREILISSGLHYDITSFADLFPIRKNTIDSFGREQW